jgi:L-2,4-diaminobutyrate transaminase
VLFDPSLKVGARVAAACLERGLIARPMPEGDILGLAPPLCLSQEEADEIVRIVKHTVDVLAHELTASAAVSGR